MKRFLLWLLRGYQKQISPLSGPKCRFQPTCSHYALEAIETHGAMRGMYLALRRLLRCHPFHKGGFDPVPPPRMRRADKSKPVEALPGEGSCAHGS